MKKKQFTWINLLQIVTLAALLIYMEMAVNSGKISKIFLASPSSIVEELFASIKKGVLGPHLLVTLQEVFAGYLLAILVGVSLGLLWTLFPKLEAYMNVFCAAIMAIPKTAILPLLILWFGIGFKSKVVLIFLFSVFQILVIILVTVISVCLVKTVTAIEYAFCPSPDALQKLLLKVQVPPTHRLLQRHRLMGRELLRAEIHWKRSLSAAALPLV